MERRDNLPLGAAARQCRPIRQPGNPFVAGELSIDRDIAGRAQLNTVGIVPTKEGGGPQSHPARSRAGIFQPLGPSFSPADSRPAVGQASDVNGLSPTPNSTPPIGIGSFTSRLPIMNPDQNGLTVALRSPTWLNPAEIAGFDGIGMCSGRV